MNIDQPFPTGFPTGFLTGFKKKRSCTETSGPLVEGKGVWYSRWAMLPGWGRVEWEGFSFPGGRGLFQTDMTRSYGGDLQNHASPFGVSGQLVQELGNIQGG